MRESTLFRWFPAPRYLEMRAAGIDISDRSVKFMEFEAARGTVSALRYGEELLTPGIVEGGRIMKADELTAVLVKVRAKLHTAHAIVALPEEVGYVFGLTVPQLRAREIAGSVLVQLENNIPLPASSVVFDYEPLPGANTHEQLLSVSAFPATEARAYTEALTKAGINPRALEIETSSLVRAVLPEGNAGATLVVDFGKTRTGLAVVCNAAVLGTATIASVGGEDVSKVLEKALNISHDEAEKLKQEKGLSRAPEHKAVFEALLPIISVLKDELRRYLGYWQSHAPELFGVPQPVTSLILAGGQATLPALDEYLAANLGVDVVVANPWQRVPLVHGPYTALPFNESLRYVTAIGCALRGANLL